MTSEVYQEKIDTALNGFHPLLASKIREIAYDQNHSGGYEEVANKVETLATEFFVINELLVKGKGA